jgi:hypothetical protein
LKYRQFLYVCICALCRQCPKDGRVSTAKYDCSGAKIAGLSSSLQREARPNIQN